MVMSARKPTAAGPLEWVRNAKRKPQRPVISAPKTVVLASANAESISLRRTSHGIPSVGERRSVKIGMTELFADLVKPRVRHCAGKRGLRRLASETETCGSDIR